MMPSPLPGMDPYLEAPSIWPDVHTSLMSIFREQLTPLLAPKYLAELETQVVIDRLDDDLQVMLLDVSVTSPDMSAEAPAAVAVAAPAPVRVRVPLDVPTRLVSVYIRQRETARLVAVGRHGNRLVMVPYEQEHDTVTPVTMHATTRQQVNVRLRTGRFIIP
jgi:hypothetical protein